MGCPFLGNNKYNNTQIEEDENYFKRITAQNIMLVKKSWKWITSGATTTNNVGEFTEDFYKMFFNICPLGKRLFEVQNFKKQKSSLLQIFNFLVNNLDNDQEYLEQKFKKLSVKHTIFGVTESEYRLFSQSLIQTLKMYLGDKLTEDIQESWLNTILAVSSLMINEGKKLNKGIFYEIYIFKSDDDTESISQSSQSHATSNMGDDADSASQTVLNSGEDDNTIYFCHLTLTHFFTYKDLNHTQLINTYPIEGLISINTINKTKLMISIKNEHYQLEIGFKQKTEMKKFINNIK